MPPIWASRAGKGTPTSASAAPLAGLFSHGPREVFARCADLSRLFVGPVALHRRGRAGGVGVIAHIALFGVLAVVGQDVRVFAGYGRPPAGPDARVVLKIIARKGGRRVAALGVLAHGGLLG